jgi:putative tricarboxylic transport membrane protein
MAELVTGVAPLLDPTTWLYVALGVGLGILFGALPGFTATMGLAILTPLTFWVQPDQAFAMLFGLLCAAIFSGGIPAILINTPGTPASIATTWDGYPLAQQGQAGLALGINALGAFCGQMLSIAVLALAAFPLAAFALRFGPSEYFALAIFGISMMVSISSRSLLKGLLMGALGLAVSMVGLDPIVGYPRFTFGTPAFLDGISFIPVMVGLFGVAEVLVQMYATTPHSIKGPVRIERVLPSRAELRGLAGHAVLGSAIGTGVGIIPGAGGDIGSIIAWGQSRRLSRLRDRFGKGSLAGLTASCTAANAAIGGAMVTMLTLGIPGDSASAVLIGALLIHGLQPGPLLFRDHPDMVAHIVVLLAMASLVTMLFGLIGARPLARILQIRDQILWGLILIVCVLGSYALNQSVTDVWVMLLAGLAGFVLRKAEFPMGPLVLALILGPMAESNLRRALVLSQGDLSILVTRPLTVIFLLLTALSLLVPVVSSWRGRAKAV